MAEILLEPCSGESLTTHRVVVNADLNGHGDLDDTVVHMVCGSCRPSGRPERRSMRIPVAEIEGFKKELEQMGAR